MIYLKKNAPLQSTFILKPEYLLCPQLREMLKAYFIPDFWLVFKQSK